jgi:hypothetical protein
MGRINEIIKIINTKSTDTADIILSLHDDYNSLISMYRSMGIMRTCNDNINFANALIYLGKIKEENSPDNIHFNITEAATCFSEAIDILLGITRNTVSISTDDTKTLAKTLTSIGAIKDNNSRKLGYRQPDIQKSYDAFMAAIKIYSDMKKDELNDDDKMHYAMAAYRGGIYCNRYYRNNQSAENYLKLLIPHNIS